MSDDRHISFSQRYASGETPWDSGVTPPEIIDALAELPAGRALDLGCGTGTVMRDLLRQGWRADGLDFVARAIDLAGRKLSEFPADAYRLFCHDVTRLHDLPALRGDYNLIIDIGCGHCLDATEVGPYATSIASRLDAGGIFMLYASHPRPDSTVGWAPQLVAQYLRPPAQFAVGAARRRPRNGRARKLVQTAQTGLTAPPILALLLASPRNRPSDLPGDAASDFLIPL